MSKLANIGLRAKYRRGLLTTSEDRLSGVFLTIPGLLKLSSRPIITFDECPANAPETVRYWFHPGENNGHNFVYRRKKAVVLAK